MKIALFLTFDYSLKTWDESGTLDRELRIYKEMTECKDVNYIFFTYGDDNDIKYADKVKNCQVIPIYSVVKYSKYKVIRYLKSFFIPLFLKRQIHNVDIIKQNQLMGSWVSIICSALYRKPYYLRSGYDMYQFSIYEKKKWLIINLYKVLTYFTIKFSTLYSVTSNKDFIFLDKQFNIPKGHIVIRPNWVQEVTISKTKKYEDRILCVGRLCFQKNFKFIIKEFKNTNTELALDIVGFGEEKNELKKIANDFNVSVNFLDQLHHDDLMNLYSDYKYFITSSLYEGHPKTLIEAMSSGCIVFASDIPSHSEIIEDKKTGLLYKLEENCLRNLYLEVKNNEMLLNKISANSMRITSNKYAIENLLEATYKDYKSLV